MARRLVLVRSTYHNSEYTERTSCSFAELTRVEVEEIVQDSVTAVSLDAMVDRRCSNQCTKCQKEFDFQDHLLSVRDDSSTADEALTNRCGSCGDWCDGGGTVELP